MSITTPLSPVGGFTYNSDDQVRHQDLSADEIAYYVDHLESILQTELTSKRVNTSNSHAAGAILQYTTRDIHLIPDHRPERLIKFELSHGMHQSYKSVLTGPFYMQTSDQYCRLYESQIKNFSTFALVYVPLWISSGGTGLSVDCVNKSAVTDQEVENYFLKYNGEENRLTRTLNFP